MRLASALAVGVLASAWSAPSVARADDVMTCVSASELAQLLRDEGKYKKTREQLLVCMREVCPTVVRRDCVQWLGEVDALMPSVVLSAKDAAGHDLSDARVTLDGAPLTNKLDGRPIALDPGEHVLRFEVSGASMAEERLVMHAGEKHRAVTVKLGPPVPSPAAPPSPPVPPSSSASGRAPIGAYVIGGLGVAALGAFAYLGLTGRSDVSEMRSTCAPLCDPSRVDAARAKLLVADVSLGAGVVALGAAAYILLTRGPSAAVSPTTGATRLDVRAVAGGGVAEFGARF
jgi:hypothetical protein